MMRYIQFILVTALTAAVLAAVSALAQQPSVSADGAWSRASLGTARPGVLYVTLTNTGEAPVTLTGIETEAAAKPELHQSNGSDGVSTMTPVEEIRIAPGESVALEPGGLHGMLMQLRAPLEEGDSFTARLIFEEVGTLELSVPVRSMAATGPAG